VEVIVPSDQFHPEVQTLNNPDPMILVLRAHMQTLYRTIVLKSCCIGRDGIVGSGLSVWLLACLFSWLEGVVAVGLGLEESVLV
jgi:hypothetical protein